MVVVGRGQGTGQAVLQWPSPAGRHHGRQLLPTTIHFLFSPLPLRPSWLPLPELSPLASSQAGTWQVDEGRVSHSFLENCGPDKLPKGRGHVQPASPGTLSSLFCSKYSNCNWKKRGTYRLTPGVGPSFWLCLPPVQVSSVLPGSQDTGLRRQVQKLFSDLMCLKLVLFSR